MNSCLYECRIMHCRVKPKYHKLNTTIFMFYLDLDEIDVIDRKLKLFSRNRFNIYNFADRDHLEIGGSNVKENILLYLKSKGVETPVKRIMLFTNLKTFGYNFNPVSFYFCYDMENSLVCVVPEIGNTFGELKPFYIGKNEWDGKMFDSKQVKYYYISPFIDLDAQLHFRLRVPDDKLDIKIDDIQNGEKFFYATMSGERKELTDANLFLYTILFPFVTLKVIMLIHWHALLLMLKGIKYHAKEANPQYQREVTRVWHKN